MPRLGAAMGCVGEALVTLDAKVFWHLAKQLISSLKRLRGIGFSPMARQSRLYRIQALETHRSMTWPKSRMYHRLALMGVL